MRILISCNSCSGGAPRSMFEYACALKRMGHSLLFVGKNDNSELYKQYIIECDDSEEISCLNGTLGERTEALLKVRDLLVSKKIDLVITISYDSMYIPHIADLCAIPCIVLIAGGQVIERRCYCWRNKQLIVFSQENKDDLIRQNHKAADINVISNRIDPGADFRTCSICIPEVSECPIIEILMISRLDPNKTGAVIAAMDLVEFLFIHHLKVRLKVAGAGTETNFINDKASKINANCKTEVIELLGHVDDIVQQIDKSIVVLGEGRSVLQAVMRGRIGIVVSNTGEMALCTGKSFNNLYHFNFSGRNIDNAISQEYILSILQNSSNLSLYSNELEAGRKKILDAYSSEYLELKLDPIVQKVCATKIHTQQHECSHIRICMYFWLSTIEVFLNRVKRRLVNVFTKKQS